MNAELKRNEMLQPSIVEREACGLIGTAFRASTDAAGVAGLSCFDLVRKVYKPFGMKLPESPAFYEMDGGGGGRCSCGNVVFDMLRPERMAIAGDLVVEREAGDAESRHISVALSPFEVVESARGVGVRKLLLATKRRAGRMQWILRPVGIQEVEGHGQDARATILPGPMGDPGTAILIALAVVSAIGSALLAPKPNLPSLGSDSNEGQRYGFSRYSREASLGEPRPVVLGSPAKTGGVLIAANPTIEDDQGNSRLRMLILLSDGEIDTIGDRTSDFDAIDASEIVGLEINDQPATAFVGVKVWGRMGTDAQAIIPGFDDTEIPREIGVGGVVLRNTDGVERTGGSESGEAFTFRTVTAVNAAIIRVRFSQGLYTLAGESAQLEPRAVKYRYRTRPVVSGTPGSWSSWTVVTTTRAERAELFASRRLDALADPAEIHDVQVERVSVEPAEATISDTMLWDACVEIAYADNNYAGCAMLAVEITAGEQINASAPRISVACRGVKVRVWDGISDPSTPTFATAWSNNPADLALAVLTDERWGMGARYIDSDIDMASLLAWRTDCAEAVARSDAGTRPRFAYNRTLTSASDGVDVLRSICAAGHAVPVKVGGKWAFVVDKAQTSPVEVFTDGSVAVGESGEAEFEYTRQRTTGGRTVPNQIAVQFENDRNAGETDTAVWPPDGTLWLATEPLRQESIRMDGVTDPDQAAAEAVYQCKKRRLRSRAVSFQTTRPMVTVRPGERFDLALSVTGWGLSSGRVRAGCTTGTIILDEAVTLAVDTAYRVRIIHADNETETVDVTSPAGVYAAGDTISVGTLAQAPAQFAEYAMGVSGIEAKPFLCESASMVESKGLVWRLAGIEYVEGVYDSSDAVAPEIRYSDLSGNLRAPGPVSDIRAAERFIASRLRIELAWSQEPDDRRRTASYRIFRRIVGTGTWQGVPNPTVTTTGAALDITEQDRAYEFCVVAVSAVGAALSPYDPSVPVATLVMGLAAAPPEPPTGLAIENVGGNTYRLSWDAAEGAASYQVLVGGDTTGLPNVGAEDCIILARTTETEVTGLELAPGVAVRFWVRSVGASGRMSFTAVTIEEASPATPPGTTIKDTKTFDLSTEGTLDNLSWTSSRLRLTSAASPGTWTSGWEDLTTSSLCELSFRIGTQNDATDPAINTDPFTAPSIAADQWGIVSLAPPVIGMLFPPYPDNEQTVRVEVRTNDGASDSDWTTLAAGASLTRTFRKYQVRVTLARANAPYRPALRSMVVVVTE